MVLLMISIAIAFTVVMLGMKLMGTAGKKINMRQLRIYIALGAGFMLAALFMEILPEYILIYPGGPHQFFRWTLAGVFLVIFFERYLLPKLHFVEHFFHHHEHEADAAHCEHPHQHTHLHQHTHPESFGRNEACSAIACFMICSFFDGIALSSIQAVDQRLGIVMILGVILHLLPEGILSGAMALAGGAPLRVAKKVIIFIGGAFVLGAVIPFFVTGYETTFLALAAGIILFVDLVQLLPAALNLRYAPFWIAVGIFMFVASHALIELGH